jgi:hypothetical protein
MLRDEDLDQAVKAGVITPEQRRALAQRGTDQSDHLADHLDSAVDPDDERFRFLRGFNDVFLTLGVLFVTGAFLTQWSPTTDTGGLALIIGAGVLWALSEVLVARHKAVLPGVASVLAIGLLASLAAAQWAIIHGYEPAATSLATAKNFPFKVWLIAVGFGWLWVLAFYVRFRFPFALLPLGVGLMATVLLAIWNRYGFDTPRTLINVAALAMGLVTFAAALRFDASDPERQTRRADCGFWLHLAAAPFIVHPVISLFAGQENAAAALVTIALVVVLALVALVIDRRAVLVSSLTYFGLAIAYLVRADHQHGGFELDPSITTTLAVLGAFVILMGLGWHPLRRLLLTPFSGSSWLKYLPPVKAA